MEGRESAVFFGSNLCAGVNNSPSSTPSPTSSASPPPPAGGFACLSRKAGAFIGGNIGGVPAAAPAAPPAASNVEGTGMMGSAGSSFTGGLDELMAKKRGRPRKYGPENTAIAVIPQSSSPFSPGADFSGKRSRGRPPGSGRCQLLATLGEWFQLSAGGSFTPHVVTIAAGEDVAARILSFSHKGPRAVCILSANGAISNVTLRQPGSSGGTLTYEGRFELLSLSGSFTTTDCDGVRSRTGGLSVSLAGPDGRVVGGGVAGLLLAASPIQIVVGSFLPNAFKEHKKQLNADPSPFYSVQPSSCLRDSTPTSQTAQDEECQNSKSTAQVTVSGEIQNNPINNSELNPPERSFRAVHWQGLQPPSEPKPYPDINLCLQGE